MYRVRVPQSTRKTYVMLGQDVGLCCDCRGFLAVSGHRITVNLLVGGCLCYQAFHRKSGCCMPSASWHATEAADSWTSTDCSRVEAASNVLREFAHGG